MADIILIDLRKAFDIIDRDVLLRTYMSMVSQNTVVHWFKLCHYNRSFLVDLGILFYIRIL